MADDSQESNNPVEPIPVEVDEDLIGYLDHGEPVVHGFQRFLRVLRGK